jgi:hypothetical protein
MDPDPITEGVKGKTINIRQTPLISQVGSQPAIYRGTYNIPPDHFADQSTPDSWHDRQSTEVSSRELKRLLSSGEL